MYSKYTVYVSRFQVSHSYVCEYHRGLLYSMNSMRAKRKRKDSEEESDYQFEVKPMQHVASCVMCVYVCVCVCVCVWYVPCVYTGLSGMEIHTSRQSIMSTCTGGFLTATDEHTAKVQEAL